VKNYLDWGAGPRAQKFNFSCKNQCGFNGKFTDIEDVKAVAIGFCVTESLKL
jgi:hypothetical protein